MNLSPLSVNSGEAHIATERALYTYNSNGKPLGKIEYSQPLTFHESLTFHGRPNVTYCFIHREPRARYLGDTDYEFSPSFVQKIDLDGSVYESVELPSLAQKEAANFTLGKGLILMFSSLAHHAHMMAKTWISSHFDHSVAGKKPRDFGQILKQQMGLLASEAGLGLIAAFGVLFVSRRHRLPRHVTWGWFVGVWFLSWPGLLAFWLVREWSAQTKCANCGKKRRVEESHCHHCQAQWPVPTKDGTEIF